jgi:U3 small nucleolar RNA-associated protein 4
MDYSAQNRLVACWWEREVSIWRIIPGKNSSEKRHELKARIALQGEENITSVSISQRGDRLAVANSAEVKIFALAWSSHHRGPYQVRKIGAVGTSGARLVKLSPDLKWIAVLTTANEVIVSRRSKKMKYANPQNLRREKTTPIQDPALGDYLNTINRIEFSPDSKMLVVSDLRGYIDSWVFNTSNDLLEVNGKEIDAETSSEDSDSGDETLASGWKFNSANRPKLESSAIVLSFKKQEGESKYNLFVVTSKHRIREIDMDSGYFTEWSKRNPNSVLPEGFKRIKDRAMGAFWGVNGWLWLYGSSWMFGLNTSVDHSEAEADQAPHHSHDEGNQSKKRKHDGTGAGGSRKKAERTGLVLDPDAEIQATVTEQDEDSEEESDDEEDVFAEGIKGGHEISEDGRKGKAKWYITHRYRPILGIVPVHEGDAGDMPEVVLVERPVWCLDLPGRYESEYS